MTALLVEAVYSCSSQRYLRLVHELLGRYRHEAIAIALELDGACRDLAAIEDELRRPELPRSHELLLEHDRISSRIETLERDLADAREAARGAQEEITTIEEALSAD